MKKKKWLKIILIVILVLIFFNIAYYLITSWRNFPIIKNALSSPSETVSLKTYSNSKMGFEVKYPASWIVQDNGNTVEIDPSFKGGVVHFSIGPRNDFKSLDDVKKTLATSVPITPVQVNNASGFEYSDSPSYEAIWLLHSGQIYLIRTYSNLALGDEEADQIFSTFKFTN
jgi:regulatory protein YycH of two-component signal transduction system YycFG